MISIFIELIDDDGDAVYVNVDHIISIEKMRTDKVYSRIHFSNGDTYTVEKSPKHILDLICQANYEKQKENTICLT